MSLFREKMLIFNRCISGLMPGCHIWAICPWKKFDEKGQCEFFQKRPKDNLSNWIGKNGNTGGQCFKPGVQN